MGDLRQQLEKLASKNELPLLADGRYKLADRTILVKNGEQYTLLRHRNKGRYRSLSRLPEEALRKLLLRPDYGSHTKEELKGLNKGELVRKAYPRPKMTFCQSWLETSSSPEAAKLRELVKKARRL
jgi:hypothetical protein